MTYRHSHVTQYLYCDQESALRRRFRWVYPLPSADHIRWVSFMERDMDDETAEIDMPYILGELEHILPTDIEVVSAWENDDNGDRTRVWLVRGITADHGLRAKYLDAEGYPLGEPPYSTAADGWPSLVPAEGTT
jgi:hypothetical protein